MNSKQLKKPGIEVIKQINWIIDILVPKDEQNENIPEFRRIKDRRISLDTILREQKELFLIIFQVKNNNLFI